MKKTFLSTKMLDFLYSFSISFCTSYSLLLYFVIKFDILILAITCLIGSLVYMATSFNKIVFIGFSVAFSIISILCVFLIPNLLKSSAAYFGNILKFYGSQESFTNYFWYILITFIISYVFIFINTKLKLHAITFFVSLVFFIMLFITTDEISNIVFYLFLLTMTLSVVVVAGNGFRKNHGLYKDLNCFKIAMYLSPFLIIMLALILVLFKPDKPIMIPWLDTKINDFLTKQALSVDNGNSFAMNAFGLKTNRLDGAVLPNGLKVLTIQTESPFNLKSSVKEVYNKNKWETKQLTYEDTENETLICKTEAENALKYLGVTSNFEYLFKQKATVTLVDISTTQLYQSILVDEISVPTDMLKFSNNGDISFRQKQGKDFTYNFNAYIPIFGSDNFASMLRKSYKGLYSSFAQNNGEDELTAKLITRTNEIESKFLQLSSSLTNRTYNLSKQITKNKNNNYDKAVAIEQYLSKNYTYNLYVKSNPPNVDFVDNFLFETKNGYCTYYATSMVILARIAGIPARYVEGYSMPNLSNIYDEYKITNLNAHAWPELYFEGFGWLSFEPTSIKTDNYYRNNESLAKSIVFSDPDNLYQPLTFNSSSQVSSSSSEIVEEIEDTSSFAPDSFGSIVETSNEDTYNFLQYFYIGFLVVVILLILGLYIFMLTKKNRADKLAAKHSISKNNNAVIALFEQYINLIIIITKQTRAMHITLNEYVTDLSVFDDFYTTSNLKEITDIYLAAVYSNKQVDEQSVYKVINYYPILKQHLKETTKKSTLIYCKYIKGII